MQEVKDPGWEGPASSGAELIRWMGGCSVTGWYQADRWSSGVQEAERGDQEDCQLIKTDQQWVSKSTDWVWQAPASGRLDRQGVPRR